MAYAPIQGIYALLQKATYQHGLMQYVRFTSSEKINATYYNDLIKNL
jgi:hypothetical protein